MIAKLFASSVIVEDHCHIDKLQSLGIGANRLSPIIINKNQKQLLNYVHKSIAINNEIDRNNNNNNDRDNTCLASYIAPLLLLDEEALYLCKYNNLLIYNELEVLTDLDSLWSLFIYKTPKFISKYKVYEHYKNCKYIIKTGMNFGADYALYRGLPSECHSEMCIIVVDATNNNHGIQEMINNSSELSWRHISTLTRVMPDIMKICILCYVLEERKNNNINNIVDNNNEVKCTIIEERSAYLDLLFPNIHHQHCTTDTNKTDIVSYNNRSNSNKSNVTYLDLLTVHPITVSIRRTSTLCKDDRYETITDLYEKYVNSAKKQKKNNHRNNKNHNNNSNNNSYDNNNGNNKKDILNDISINNVSGGDNKDILTDSNITVENSFNTVINDKIHIDCDSNINKNIDLNFNDEYKCDNLITINNINSDDVDISTNSLLLNACANQNNTNNNTNNNNNNTNNNNNIINKTSIKSLDHTFINTTDTVITTIASSTTTSTSATFTSNTNANNTIHISNITSNTTINNTIDTNNITLSEQLNPPKLSPISQQQQRYSKKANRVRRDHKVVRFKELTKSNKVFRKLMNSPTTTINNSNYSNNVVNKIENISIQTSYNANTQSGIVDINNHKRTRNDDSDQKYHTDEISFNKLKNNHPKDTSKTSIFESCLVM